MKGWEDRLWEGGKGYLVWSVSDEWFEIEIIVNNEVLLVQQKSEVAIKVGPLGKLTFDGAVKVTCDTLYEVDTSPYRGNNAKVAIWYLVCRQVNFSLELPKIKSLIQCATSTE